MFQRIANSFALARSSWNVLVTDKQLLLFPILSGIACVLVTASFFVPLVVVPVFLQHKQLDDLPEWVYGVTLFGFYFCTYFVIVFFNSALTHCAMMRFRGETPTLGDGLKASAVRLPQILAWALVSASVGILLRLVENINETAGKIVSAILGTAWSIVTFFVIPVLVVENLGPIDAVKRSVQILKRAWGEALVGNFGIGMFVFLLAIPIFLVLVLGVMICVAAPPLLPLGIAVIALAVVGFLLLMAVSSAMGEIFVAALYQYAARGEIAQGFDERTIRHAFTSK